MTGPEPRPGAADDAGGPTPAGERREPVSILLVDDRTENLIALEAILETMGEHLVRASSGEEALRWVLRRDFAVILLDVQMPGMNGFEAARLIKARERSKHIPIIFLTAISKEERYVFEGYTVGAVDYMFKPFEPDILRSKVAVFVELYRKTQQLQRQAQLLAEGARRELELRHQAALQKSEVRLAEVVRSVMDAIVTVDGDLNVTLFNAAAERMFGRASDDVIGTPVSALFADECREECVDTIRRAAASAPAGAGAPPGAVPMIESCVGSRPDGGTFPIEATISVLDLAEERIVTVVARDITERKRAEEELKAQAHSLAVTGEELKTANEELHRRQLELEKAMSARSRFYASMSHELRTPINAILGYNTLLIDGIYGPLNEKQTHSLKRVQKAAKHLLELVNDVLDLSKIEAGKIELQLQAVAFPALCEDLSVTVRPMADEAGSELVFTHEGDNRTVITDPRRVRQVLLNLLSNAIKFGAGKPIRVISRGRADGGVEIDVIDHGTGIATEDIPRIFDEFVQLEKTEQQGTGLGLPISKRLASLLDGALDVWSQVGVGSTFRLSLPASADRVGPSSSGGKREAGGEKPGEKSGDKSAESSGDKPEPEPALASRG